MEATLSNNTNSMEQEDLTASHWDDVLSPTTGSMFGNLSHSVIAPPPQNEFNALALDDSDSQVEDEEEVEHQTEEQNEDETMDTGDIQVDTTRQAELDQLNELKREELQEHKHQILSELTKNDEDDQILGVSSSIIVSPKKANPSDSLFNVKDSPIKVEPLAPRSTQPNTSSPKRNLKNSHHYRNNPRPRKFTSKAIVKQLDSTSSSFNPLGPLGRDSEDSASIASIKSNNNKAEQLLQEVEAPLYEISSQSREEALKELSQAAPRRDDIPSNTPTSVDSPKHLDHNILDISVGDPMKVGDITSAHIVYSIRTKNKNPDAPNFPHSPDGVTVSRRYKDFRWIYHQLQNNHPGHIIPPPPTKQTYIGRFNENFIENRRLSLEKMLSKISHLPVLCNDADFLMFLTSENFGNESKERERLSGSGASLQSNEFLDNDNDNDSMAGSVSSIASAPLLSGSSGAGFMSTLFSISNKVNEPDEYFVEKKQYIDELEFNLKNFYKAIELIGTQRIDMIGILDEISLTLDELAAIEILKLTSELLGAFSEVQMKLKENLDRINLQDQLTLGFTIEEYLRIIGSIKFVFETRYKVYQQYYTYNQELQKKQSQLDKLNKKYNAQVDKINLLTFEVDKLKQKTAVFEKKFNSISDTIKQEITNFEFEKIENFRNSVEIFIESSIESQKEAIELYETFYERQNLA